jgi:hypothetical protein
MSSTSTPATGQDRLGTEPRIAVVFVAPEPDQSDAARLVALGGVMLASGAFLIVMFVSLARGGSAAPWGPINDLLSAAGNVLLAILVPRISRGAARTARERGFVRLIAGTCLVAAASGVLLVAQVLPFEPSTAISMVAITLQAAWMAWLNTAWSRDPRMPRSIWRTGGGVGYGLAAGLALTGASFLFPWGSTAAKTLLYPGVAIGGALWLAWPLWFVLLGRHLRPAPDTDTSTHDQPDA